MKYDKNLMTITAGKKKWFYIPGIWIKVFHSVLNNKMERPPHNIESCQFL